MRTANSKTVRGTLNGNFRAPKLGVPKILVGDRFCMRGGALKKKGTQHHLRLHDVQRAGHALFDKGFNADDPISDGPYVASTLNPATDPEDRARFHRQASNNNIIDKTIENMLSVDGMDDLLVDKNLFTYVNAEGRVQRHGATMLYLI